MKNKTTKEITCLIFSALIFLSGCKQDSSVISPVTKIYNSGSAGNYSITDEHLIIVRNFIGSVLVIGEGTVNPAVRWFIYKTVEAETDEQADSYFTLINPSFEKRNDTVIATLNVPGGLPLRGMLELDIPYNMRCRVEYSLENTYVFDLDSSLYIQSRSNVEVMRHNGSCEISCNQGNVSVETAIPFEGYCRVTVQTGHILISIPTNTSVEVYAKSNNGSVSQTGLTFTNIQQDENSISGTLGSGAGEIRAVTGSGNIELKGF
jgi:hypothetical protein